MRDFAHRGGGIAFFLICKIFAIMTRRRLTPDERLEIKTALLEKSVTQADLADQIGLSETQMSRVLDGKTKSIDVEQFVRIIEYLGLPRAKYFPQLELRLVVDERLLAETARMFTAQVRSVERDPLLAEPTVRLSGVVAL